jgi:translation elongation factor EF-Ts
MLYTLVCGRPPFERTSPSPDRLADFVQQVRLSAPPSLGASFVAAAARFATTGINVGFLNSVLGKALEKSPDARYQTAGEFRADLQALLDGHVPAAAVKTRFDRMRRMVRMNRVACAAAFIAFLALSSAAVFEGYSASAQRVAQEATQAANDAQAVSIAQQEATIKVFHGILNAVVTDLRALGNAKELSKYWPKIIEGKVAKWYTDVTLLGQEAVIEAGATIDKQREALGKVLGGEVTIHRFVRFSLGEGIEKKTDDLAEEVAKLM